MEDTTTTPPVIDSALLLQAVSDGTRLRLLSLLAREELNVRELVGILGMSQPRVSKHLALLRDAGWIQQRRDRTWNWYRATSVAAFAGGPALHAGVLGAAERSPQAATDARGLAGALRERDQRARRFFAGAAARWDEIRRAYERPEVHVAALSALVPAGTRVVDIGTGTGALLPLLSAAGCWVAAIDNSEPMLARARELCAEQGLAGVALQRADLQALPLRDAAGDAVFCSMVLHHVARPAAAVAEMGRVVRPGGRVVLLDFARHDLAWMREDLAHQWLGFTRREIEEWSEAAGLRVRMFRTYPGGRETQDLLPAGPPAPARTSPRPVPGAAGRGGGAGRRRGRQRASWPDLILSIAEKIR